MGDVLDTPEPDAQSEEDTEFPASSPIPAPPRRRRIIPQLPDLDSAEESQPDTPTQQDGHTPTTMPTEVPMRRRAVQFCRRRARALMTVAGDNGAATWTGLEGKLLKVQRLQCKNMRLMQGQLETMATNIGDIRDCMKELTTAVVEGQRPSNENFANVTKAMHDLCRVMQDDHAGHRRRHRNLMVRLDRWAINRLSTITAQLSRRAVGMQIEMSHC